MYNCLITGSGRSGTSMVAGVLASSGYFMGDDLIPAREANPKGFFESTHVNVAINEQILIWSKSPKMIVRQGHWWITALPFDSVIVSSYEVRKHIRKMTAHKHFCYKDPRFCYTLSMWRPFLENTKFICVFRHPASTIASMMKEYETARYMYALDLDERKAENVWSTMYTWILDRQSKKGDWLFVHYDQVINGEGVDKIEKFLDAPVDRTFPDKNLKKKQPDIKISKKTQKIYNRLLKLAEV